MEHIDPVPEDEGALPGNALRWRADHVEYALHIEPEGFTLRARPLPDERAEPTPRSARAAAVRRNPRAGKAWTEEEDEALRGLHAAGTSRRAMAEAHERSVGAIRARLIHLGLEAPDLADLLPSQRPLRAALAALTEEVAD